VKNEKFFVAWARGIKTEILRQGLHVESGGKLRRKGGGHINEWDEWDGTTEMDEWEAEWGGGSMIEAEWGGGSMFHDHGNVFKVRQGLVGGIFMASTVADTTEVRSNALW